MSILFTDGFDNYGTVTGTNILTRWTSVSAPANISTTITPWGYGQSFFISSFNQPASVGFTATSSFTVGAAIRSTGLSTGVTYPIIAMLSSATSMIELVFSVGGIITVTRNQTIIATSAPGTVKTSTWYYIELSVSISDTVGTVRVDVDGSTVINQTGLDTRNGTPTTVNTLSLRNNNDSGTVYFDDFYITDSATPLGPQRIHTLRPNADTAEKDWVSAGSWILPFVSNISASGATRGNIFYVDKNVSISEVSVYLGAIVQTVKLGIAQLSSPNPGAVSSVLYDSASVVRSAVAGLQSYTFSPVTLTAGNYYAIYATRTDGTISVGAQNSPPVSDATGSLTWYSHINSADNDIQIGDNLYNSTLLYTCMNITFNGLSNYQTVADPNDTDADVSYVTASTIGDFDLYDIENHPNAASTIKAVNHLVWAKKTDATTRTINLTTKSGATTTDSTAVTLATSYAGYSNLYETNPDTATNWTVSDVNALQIGQKVAS